MVKHFDPSITDAIVVAQATLAPSKTHLLAKALATQPAWSNLPIILLAKAGRKDKRAGERTFEILGNANVTLLLHLHCEFSHW